jgi:hypothetical protein
MPTPIELPVIAATIAPMQTPAVAAAPVAIPTPARAAVPVLDSASAALIDSTIAALEALDDQPLALRVELPEDTIVPIESLLYRGRSALDRAVEIRDEIKRGGQAPDPDALEELFDLLELARAG